MSGLGSSQSTAPTVRGVLCLKFNFMKRTIKNAGCFLFLRLGLSSVFLLLTAPLCLAQSLQVSWARQVDAIAGGVSTDQGGSIYIAGYGDAGILTKYDSLGDVLWTASAHGNGLLWVQNVTTDQAGNSYIIGEFWRSAIFGTNVISSAYGSFGEGFVAKVDSNGRFLWAQPLVASGGADALSVACDNNGNCYVTGFCNEEVFFGGTNYINGGFIAKFSPTGTLLRLTETQERENAIAVDNAGNISVIGSSYLAKYNDYGGLYWITPDAGGYAVAIGSDGSIYTAGLGWTNGFICKYSSSGNPIWTCFTTNAGPFSIALDSSDSVYVSGYYSGSNYVWASAPANFNGTVLPGSVHLCSFAAKYDTSGDLKWVKGFSGAGDVCATGVAVSSSGSNAVVTGTYTTSITFGNFTLSTTNSQHFYQALFLVDLGVVEGPSLALQVQKGQSPALTIGGVAGNTYEVEFTDSLTNGWNPWVKFVLPSSPYTLFDPSPGLSNRFYRAYLVQP